MKHVTEIILVTLIVGCLITMIVILTKSCKKKGKLIPDVGTGTLWIWEDSQGGKISELPDFNGSYESGIVNYFSQVNLIAEIKQPSYTNTLWDDMQPLYNHSNTKYWLSVYFGKDGFFGDCRSGDNTECQKAIKTYLNPYLKNETYTIDGIVVDKEGAGNPWDVISTFCKNNKLKLVLGAGINSCGGPPTDKTSFDACLGETYTLGKLTYNNADCTMTDFWNVLPKISNTVPLLCMTGNCIETRTPTKPGWSCNDNRITSEQLKILVSKKPVGADLGLWYGAGLVTPLNGCTMTSSNCNKGCCSWK